MTEECTNITQIGSKDQSEMENLITMPTTDSNNSVVPKATTSKVKTAGATKQLPKATTSKVKTAGATKPAHQKNARKNQTKKKPPPPVISSSSSSESELDSTDSSSTSEDDSENIKKQIKELQETIKKLKKKVNKPKKKSSKKRKRDSSSDETSEEEARSTTIKQRKLLHNSGLKAGDNLSDKLKKKIWRHKYVDFHNILYPNQEESLQLALNTNNSKNTAALEFTTKKKRKLTEREWCLAFDDFVAIYIRKHPEEMQDLMSYSKFVKKLMAAGDNWLHYDYKFRVDREHSLCNWSHIRIDLQIDAARYKAPSPELGNSYKSRLPHSGPVPKGFCFHYHAKNSVCRKGRTCSFRHNCPRCSALHPAFLECGLQKPYHSREMGNVKESGVQREGNNLPSAQNVDPQFFQNRTGHANQTGSSIKNAQRVPK